VTKRVSLQGCGCHTIYPGPSRSGRAFYVTKRGNQDIVLSRIRSVYRHECREEDMRNALPEFVIIGAVLVIIFIVGGGILIITKIKKTLYDAVISFHFVTFKISI
jgi:hypothetical protein